MISMNESSASHKTIPELNSKYEELLIVHTLYYVLR